MQFTDDVAGRLPPPDRLALFLDIDGTLIGPRHEDREAGLTSERLGMLERLLAATGGATAILTGRSIEVVDELLRPLELPVGGLQGADRRYPDGRRVMPVLGADERRLFERVVEDVRALYPMVEIEWKPAGIALVYDEGAPFAGQLASLAEDRVGDAFKVMRGRVAIDVVPPDADKGRALDAMMAEPAFSGRTPVHVGDDLPDRPAFAAAQRKGGFGVAVGTMVTGLDLRLLDHEATWAMLGRYTQIHGIP